MKRKTKKTQVSIKGDTHAKVVAHCVKKDITIAQFVDDLCVDFLDKQDEKQKAK